MDANQGKDLALLGLSSPLALSTAAAQPIGLVTTADLALTEPGQWATMTGWGKTYPDSGTPNTLQKLDMPIVTQEETQAYYSYWNIPVYDDELGAGYLDTYDKSVCAGDSGSPLIVRKADNTPLLAGVPNLTPSPCGQAGPVMFIRISSFVTWLTDNIATAPVPAPPSPSLDESNLSGAAGAWQHFQIDVPVGFDRLDARISGGTGDADLYVRYGSKPTTSSYGCRPYLAGNEESCTFTNPAAGIWYISVRAYSDYSGVNLSARISDAVDEKSLSGSAGTWLHYQIDVPAGSDRLIAQSSGGTGDVDLYVRYDAKPTTSAYACRPYKSGNEESCTIASPAAGIWYVSVRGYKDFTGVNLSAHSE